MIRRPPRSPLFPSPTLSRSGRREPGDRRQRGRRPSPGLLQRALYIEDAQGADDRGDAHHRAEEPEAQEDEVPALGEGGGDRQLAEEPRQRRGPGPRHPGPPQAGPAAPAEPPQAPAARAPPPP